MGPELGAKNQILDVVVWYNIIMYYVANVTKRNRSSVTLP